MVHAPYAASNFLLTCDSCDVPFASQMSVEKQEQPVPEAKVERNPLLLAASAPASDSAAAAASPAPVAPPVAPIPDNIAVDPKPLGQFSLHNTAIARAHWSEQSAGLVYQTTTYRAFGYATPSVLVRAAATGKPYIEKLARLEWHDTGSTSTLLKMVSYTQHSCSCESVRGCVAVHSSSCIRSFAGPAVYLVVAVSSVLCASWWSMIQ